MPKVSFDPSDLNWLSRIKAAARPMLCINGHGLMLALLPVTGPQGATYPGWTLVGSKN